MATGDYFGNNRSVLLVSDVGANRLPTVTTFDFRLGKVIKVHQADINFDLDIFNLFNAGPILGQARVPVLPGDTAEMLAARVLVQEHRLYPTVLRRFAAGERAPLFLP